MKLDRSEKWRIRTQPAKELLPHREEAEPVYRPEEILTPEVIEHVLRVKREMEGVMIGDPTDSYVSFLAAARLALPEKEEALKPAQNMQYGIQRRLREEMENLGNVDIPQFGAEAFKVREYALTNPKEAASFLRPAKENLLKAIEQACSGESEYIAVSLAVALWVAVPESRERVKLILEKHHTTLLEHGRDFGWNAAAYLCIIDPLYKEMFRPNDYFKTEYLKILKELPEILDTPTYGDPGRWTRVLQGVFALGATTASEATLQDNGTVKYRFAHKPEKGSALPERLHT